MYKSELNKKFEQIVNTLLSKGDIDEKVIQENVRQYAKDAGVSYDLARQAVIWQCKDKLLKNLGKI